MKRQITAETKINGKTVGPVTVQYEVGNGDTLADYTKHFGTGTLTNRFLDSLDIAVQSRIRTMLKAGKKDGEIQDDLGKWALPNGTARKLTSEEILERTVKTIDKLSVDEKAALLKRLTA